MKPHSFRVVTGADRFEDGREAYRASCPALPGCRTWGHTAEEALANIREAVELYIEDLRAAGEPIPNPSNPTPPHPPLEQGGARGGALA